MTLQDKDEAEKPLDPATERVRRKMVRLLAVSVSAMLVGVMAVLVAVVYKVNARPPRPGPEGAQIAIALPAGSEVLDMALDGDEALMRLGPTSAGGLVLVDLRTGAILARYVVAPP